MEPIPWFIFLQRVKQKKKSYRKISLTLKNIHLNFKVFLLKSIQFYAENCGVPFIIPGTERNFSSFFVLQSLNKCIEKVTFVWKSSKEQKIFECIRNDKLYSIPKFTKSGTHNLICEQTKRMCFSIFRARSNSTRV